MPISSAKRILESQDFRVGPGSEEHEEARTRELYSRSMGGDGQKMNQRNIFHKSETLQKNKYHTVIGQERVRG